jgi:hypothetical protein
MSKKSFISVPSTLDGLSVATASLRVATGRDHTTEMREIYSAETQRAQASEKGCRFLDYILEKRVYLAFLGIV